MNVPKGIEVGWWKTALDGPGEAVVHAPWADPAITRREVDFLLKVLGPAEGRRLLDCGGGFGRHSLLLSDCGFSVTMLDISRNMVRLARQRSDAEGKHLRVIRGNVAEMPFADECFDCAIAMAEGGIGYQETDSANERILAELSRVLIPGGQFVIGVINGDWASRKCPCTKLQFDRNALALYRFSYDRLASRLTTKVYSFLRQVRRFHRSIGWVRLYTFDEMTRILSRLRLRVLEAYGDNSTDATFTEESFRMVLCGKKEAEG